MLSYYIILVKYGHIALVARFFSCPAHVLQEEAGHFFTRSQLDLREGHHESNRLISRDSSAGGNQKLSYDSNIEQWYKFLKSKSHKFDNSWLWQYWKDDSSDINVFGQYLSHRQRNINRLKHLIRNGVPTSLRIPVW